MGKRHYSKVALFTMLLLVFQLFVPAVQTFAATDGGGNNASESTMLPPSNLATQFLTPSDVKLTWDAVFGATGYNVYGIYDGELRFLGKATTNSFIANDMPEGSYSYVVSTLSPDGESGPCAPVEVNISYPEMAAPATLTTTTKNVNDIVLNWAASQYAQSYHVYQISTDGEQTKVATVTGPTWTNAQAPGGSYTYAVSAAHTLYGESAVSTASTVDVGEIKLAAPGNVKHTVLNGNDVKLQWDAALYATGYKIYQIIDGEKVLKQTATGTTVTLANQPAGEYSFEITTTSTRFGESEEAGKASFSLTHPTMAAPNSFKSTVANINDVTLSWEAVAYATSYKLYQVIDGEKVLKSTLTGTSTIFSKMESGDYTYQLFSYSDRFGESAVGSEVTFNVDAPEMQAPGNFTQKIQNGNDIVLSWDAAANANSYKLYQIVNGQKVLKNTLTATTVTFANQAEGEYSYLIHSSSTRFGDSKEGSSVSLTLTHPTMEAPAELVQAVTSATSFSLNWDAVPFANSYRVYQIVSGQKVLKSTVTSTTAAFTSMAPGSYTYEVRSVSSRFGESAQGSVLTFTMSGQIMPTPGNLTNTIANGNDITLKWNTTQYANTYKIYQVVDGQKVLKRTQTGTTYTLTNMPAGAYTFVVTAVSTLLGESPTGAEITFDLVHPTLAAPGSLTQTVQNFNDVVLKWNAVEFANSYKVYEIVNGEAVLQKTTSSLSTTLTSVSAGGHTYEVRAVSARFGEGPTGSTVSLNIEFPTLQAPTNLTQSIVNGNDIVLRWTAAQYATSYKIYRIQNGEKTLLKTQAGVTATFANMPAGEYDFEIHTFSDRYGESLTGNNIMVTLVHPILQDPGTVTHTIANGNDVTLKWTAVQYATGYRIYQIIDGEKVLKKETGAGITTTLANLPAGAYTFAVHAYSDRFGESPVASELSFNLVHPVMQKPGTLTNTIANGNDITLKFGTSQYATAYRIYQIIDGEKVLKRTQTSLAWTLVNLPEGEYEYAVHSYSDRFGESPEASELSFTLVHPVMQKPATFTKTIANGNDINLAWGTSQYATAYKVYQIVNGEKVLKKTQTATTLSFPNMPEGEYTFEVHSYSDRFGESPVANTLTFDLVWPVVQAPVLNATVVNANNLTLSWPAVTWANEYRVYKVTGETKEQIYKGTALSFQLHNLKEDTFSYEVTAVSTRFGESAASNRESVTIIYPDMQAPAATVKVLSTNSARISWSFVTYANGYNVYEIVNGQPVLLVQNLNALSYTLNNLSYANHTYIVTSYSNSFGESDPSNSVIAQLIQDDVAPVTTATAPSAWINEGTVVTLSATDNDTGVAKTFYSVNGGAYTEGTSAAVTAEGVHEISYYSVDRVGNIETAKTITVKIDKTAPATTSNAPTAWSQEDVKINLTATDAHSGAAATYYSVNGSEFAEGTSFTVTQEGFNTITFYTVDFADNKEQQQTVEVKIDKTAPATTSNAPTAWSQDDVNITLTATEAQAGAKTYYSVNGSEFTEGTAFTVTQEGVNTVSFYTVDFAGNKEQTQTVEVKIDKKAPTTTSDAPTVWSQEDVTINLTATDAQSGAAATYYSVNGSEFAEGTAFTVTQEGINTITFYTVDTAGNKEQQQTVEVKIDKTAPTTASDAPTVWSQDDVTVNLTATDAQGAANTYYSVNGSEFAEGTSFTVTQEGVNTVTFYSVDAAGNKEAAKTVEVKIDKTAPTTVSNAPTAWLQGDVTIDLTAADAQSGAAATYYSVNGSDFVEGMSFTVAQEGINIVTFYTVDTAGNKEQAQTVEVKIDKTAPTTASNAPATWSKDDVKVNLTAADAHSGVAKTFYSINGSSFVEGTSFTVTKEGVNKVSFYTVDAAGNQEQAKTVEVKIDKTAPLLNLDLNLEYALGITLKLNYSATDKVSGVTTQKLFVSGPGQTGKVLVNPTELKLEKTGVYTVTVTATDAAGLTTTTQKSFTVYIPASIEVTPGIIKGNNGVFTVRVSLPAGFSTQGFDLNSVRLNGEKALTSNNGYYNQAKNGQFKFERSDFTWPPSSTVELTFRGYVNGELVIGKTTVKTQK